MKPKHILLVEDDAATQEALADSLRDEGFLVSVVGDGRQGLDLLRKQPLPDLILLDLMLPEMDGWDFRAQQKRDPAIAAIPVVAISAIGKLVGAELTVRKPLHMDELLEAIRTVLGD